MLKQFRKLQALPTVVLSAVVVGGFLTMKKVTGDINGQTSYGYHHDSKKL